MTAPTEALEQVRLMHVLSLRTITHLRPQDTLCRLVQNEEGVFVLKDQLKEYQDRGEALESMNFFDYFTNTYDGKRISRKGRTAGGEGSTTLEDDDAGPQSNGRPPSLRVPYRRVPFYLVD